MTNKAARAERKKENKKKGKKTTTTTTPTTTTATTATTTATMKRGGNTRWEKEEEKVMLRGPAPGGVGDTAEEGAAAEVEGEARRAVREALPAYPRPTLPARTRRRGGAAAPSTADAGNQGLPGSAMRDDVEAGQSLQEVADAAQGVFRDDPRTKLLQEQHRRAITHAEDEIVRRDAILADRDAAIHELDRQLSITNDALRKEQGAHATETAFNTENVVKLSIVQDDLKKSRDDHAEDKLRVATQVGVVEKSRKQVAEMTTEIKAYIAHIKDIKNAKDCLETQLTEKSAMLVDLEHKTASLEQVATNNSRLEEQLAKIHTDLEDAYSDMTKGLTIDEKFAYVREQQQAALRLRDSTLHAEIEETPQASAENLSFSDIISVDTAPVAAPARQPLRQIQKPFGFSSVSSVHTAPVAAAVSVPAPVAAPVPKEILSFSGIKTTEITPIAHVAPPPAAIKTIYVKKPVYRNVDRVVDRPVVPWWMWVLLLLGLLLCAAGFAGLWHEKQIWLEANEQSYKRLMGIDQESWIEWAGTGVKELSSVMGGGTGYGLF